MEKQEKWWNDKEYHEVIDLYRSDDTSCDVYDMPKIVAEAERRGQLAAWEEAKQTTEYLKDMWTHQLRTYKDSEMHKGGEEGLRQLLERIDAKINELKGV